MPLWQFIKTLMISSDAEHILVSNCRLHQGLHVQQQLLLPEQWEPICHHQRPTRAFLQTHREQLCGDEVPLPPRSALWRHCHPPGQCKQECLWCRWVCCCSDVWSSAGSHTLWLLWSKAPAVSLCGLYEPVHCLSAPFLLLFLSQFVQLYTESNTLLWLFSLQNYHRADCECPSGT